MCVDFNIVLLILPSVFPINVSFNMI